MEGPLSYSHPDTAAVVLAAGMGKRMNSDLAKVRAQLSDTGLSDALVQNFGSSYDVLIQVPFKENLAGAKLSEQVMESLRKQDASVEKRRVEFVGPQVGKDLVENGALALLFETLPVLRGGVGNVFWIFGWGMGVALAKTTTSVSVGMAEGSTAGGGVAVKSAASCVSICIKATCVLAAAFA